MVFKVPEMKKVSEWAKLPRTNVKLPPPEAPVVHQATKRVPGTALKSTLHAFSILFCIFTSLRGSANSNFNDQNLALRPTFFVWLGHFPTMKNVCILRHVRVAHPSLPPRSQLLGKPRPPRIAFANLYRASRNRKAEFADRFTISGI